MCKRTLAKLMEDQKPLCNGIKVFFVFCLLATSWKHWSKSTGRQITKPQADIRRKTNRLFRFGRCSAKRELRYSSCRALSIHMQSLARRLSTQSDYLRSFYLVRVNQFIFGLLMPCAAKVLFPDWKDFFATKRKNTNKSI